MTDYEELDPGSKKSLLDWMQTKNPFWSLLGMEIIEIKKGWRLMRFLKRRIIHNAFYKRRWE